MKNCILILSVMVWLTGCSTWRPATDEEYQHNMRDLDVFMLSHGAQTSERP
jgi:hypothetical protein